MFLKCVIFFLSRARLKQTRLKKEHYLTGQDNMIIIIIISFFFFFFFFFFFLVERSYCDNVRFFVKCVKNVFV